MVVYFVLPFSLPSFTELMPGVIPGEDSCVCVCGEGGCVCVGGGEGGESGMCGVCVGGV